MRKRAFPGRERKYRIADCLVNMYDPSAGMVLPVDPVPVQELKAYLQRIAKIRSVDLRFETVSVQGLPDFLKDGDRNAVLTHGGPQTSVSLIFSTLNDQAAELAGRGPKNMPDTSTILYLSDLYVSLRPDSRTLISGCYGALNAGPYTPRLYGLAKTVISLEQALSDIRQEMRFWIWSGI